MIFWIVKKRKERVNPLLFPGFYRIRARPFPAQKVDRLLGNITIIFSRSSDALNNFANRCGYDDTLFEDHVLDVPADILKSTDCFNIPVCFPHISIENRAILR